MATAKFVGAWLCLIAAIALLIFGREYAGLPIVLAVCSVAFSQAPPNYK